MSYNEQEFKDNSSGRGVIPHRRYSPRPMETWLNRCDSGTDSIVWMREESFDRKSDRVIADRFLRENQSSPGSYFGGIFTLQEM